jgi:hypothetical protein
LTKLQEVIDTYQELQRMHQLNIELLEQLAVTCDYLLRNKVAMPNESTLVSLLEKAMTLLNEIQADKPKLLQYTTNRRILTGEHSKDETDKDFTESIAETYR